MRNRNGSFPSLTCQTCSLLLDKPSPCPSFSSSFVFHRSARGIGRSRWWADRTSPRRNRLWRSICRDPRAVWPTRRISWNKRNTPPFNRHSNSNSNFHFVRSNNPPPLLVFISLGSPWHSHLRYSLPETWGIGWGDGGSPRASNSGISSRSNGVSAPDSPSRGYKARFFFFFFFNW